MSEKKILRDIKGYLKTYDYESYPNLDTTRLMDDLWEVLGHDKPYIIELILEGPRLKLLDAVDTACRQLASRYAGTAGD